MRADFDRLAHERVDKPAAEAVLAVQHLAASIDQVLATANGVVATSGVDPDRFRTALGPDVAASSTLAGMALIIRTGRETRIAASVGTTPLLAGSRRGLATADDTSRLVSYRRTAKEYRLGFAQTVAHGGAVVYLEIDMPTSTSSTIPFVLVVAKSSTEPSSVMGTVASARGLTRWNQMVTLGGQRFDLFVKAGTVPTGWFGISLPELVALVGLALTILAAATAMLVVRRAYATEQLSDENRALDRALERQRVVESELLAWKSRFQTILRDTPDAIASLDLESGSCEILNRTNFLGHPVECLATDDGLRSLVHADDRDEAESYWLRLLHADAEQVFETTLRLRAGDGPERYVRLRFSRLSESADGSAETLLGLLSDVTDEWANQLREEELHEALRRSQRMEAIGQLAGGVAHDFNNVLAAVMGSIELLIDDVPSGRPMEYAHEIQHAVGRGAALVRQLLTYAQRDGAEPKIVDVNDIVSDIAQMMRRTIGTNIQLQVSTTEHACRVVADPTHIEQVILNLVVNARDAMPEGGILWIATAIDFDDVAPENDRVVLSVTDTGFGIAPEVRDRMYQPFVSTKQPGQGTGLGLATVLSIVQSLDARINVVSQVDQGTTFEVSFARCFGTASATTEFGDTEEFAGDGLRVLLVEDDVAVRAALAHLLQRLDFAVTPVANGIEAMRSIERQDFDLVLTDAMMPGMSGLELVEHLRNTRPEVRVILMSGYSAEPP
ncbi:MAG TPA: ATP-binding protein, partial [Acidimicrobiia bacterium]|nr:ATP-binding protein [Acidimicrobiia bacterium]